MNFDAAVIINQAQSSKLVHEKTHAGPGRSDHLRKRLLADFCYNRLRSAFLAEIRQKQKSPRQTLFARIEQLVDQIRLRTVMTFDYVRYKKLSLIHI